MDEASLPFGLSDRAVLEALPFGLCVYDRGNRLVLANAAFCDAVGLPQEALRPGARMIEIQRILAYRGVFGPGDPETQAQEAAQLDPTRLMRTRRRHADGRAFDLHAIPLADGGHLTVLVDTTTVLAQRDLAEAATERTALALSGLPIGVGLLDAEGRLSVQNRCFTELLGLPAHAVGNGMLFGELLALLEERGEFVGIWTGPEAGEAWLSARRISLRRTRSNGQVVDIAVDPLDGGGWSVTVSDVTSLARAEDTSRRRLATLDNVLASIPYGIAVFGPDRRIAMFNRSYARIMRESPVAIGAGMDEILRPYPAVDGQARGRVMNVLAQAVGIDLSSPLARRHRRPDGAAIDIRTAQMPDGGWLQVVTDITALLEAGAEGNRPAEEMAATLAHVRQGIIVWDRDHRLLAFNPGAVALMRHPAGLLAAGRSYEEVLADMYARGAFGTDPTSIERARALLRVDRGQVGQHELELPDGTVLEIQTAPAPGGGFVTICTDITTQRNTNAALRRAREEAEASSLAKSRLLSRMAEQLRTPLDMMTGLADALGHESAGRPEARRPAEFAAAIGAAGRQVIDLLDAIQEVARLEAGGALLAAGPIEPERLLRGCLRDAEKSAAAAQVTLELDCAPELPLLRGDERRLRRAVAQVLAQALRASPPGTEVRVTADLGEGSMMVIGVADQGRGMTEPELDLAFEPFASPRQAGDADSQAAADLRGDSASSLPNAFPGAGLGLYLARALIEAHGGTLFLRSRPGDGTTAIIQLPVGRLIMETPSGTLSQGIA